MIRLLIADDHAGMREKVTGILEAECSVVGEASDGQEMLDAEYITRPDVVVLDISMPTMDGIEAATRLRQRASEARVVFLTMHEDQALLHAALATGALGYVLKSRLVYDLPLAVKEAMAGRLFVSSPLTIDPSWKTASGTISA